MPNVQYDLATATAQLFQLRNGYAEAIAAIELTLRGSTRDVVFAAPTLPSEPAHNKRFSTVVLAAIAFGFVSVLWLLLRQSWISGALQPGRASKQGRLIAAFKFKSGPR